jgi:circadian clock protein KaiB
MMDDHPTDSTEQFERAPKENETATRVLRLYVAGNTVKSAQAIARIHEICETHLKGRYKLEVIDIYQQPHLARQAQVVATPMLVRYTPTPKKILIGDLSNTDRLLSCLRPSG